MLPDRSRVKDRYRTENGVTCVDIRLKSEGQLFDQRDPAPFREKDLEDDAAAYIVGSLREVGMKGPVKLVIHLAQKSPESVNIEVIKKAIHSYFSHEAFVSSQKLSMNFKQSQIAMLIGLSSLFLFVFLSHQLGAYADTFGVQMAREGLNIMGWVAMWRPIELTLYAWWPIWQDRRLYDYLSEIDVEVFYKSDSMKKLEQV